MIILFLLYFPLLILDISLLDVISNMIIREKISKLSIEENSNDI
jgi:hypothetical protein